MIAHHPINGFARQPVGQRDIHKRFLTIVRGAAAAYGKRQKQANKQECVSAIHSRKHLKVFLRLVHFCSKDSDFFSI